MKIFFSPEFSGNVFIGLNEQHPELMDTMVCDTLELVSTLEMHIGIHVEEVSPNQRAVAYYNAMSCYMKKHPDNALAASFKMSGLGTAKQALKWRDSLMMDKWSPEIGSGSRRLDVLAGTEEYFDSEGLVERIAAIQSYIYNKEENLFSDLEVVLPCPRDLLHPAIGELLTALEKSGATISHTPHRIAGDNNIQKVTRLLQSAEKGKVRLDEGDRSFLIYSFKDENAANEYMSFKGDELNADLWINNRNKALDNWLRMMGKPVMGSGMAKSAPQIVQLFVMGLEMKKEPLNIHSVVNWLYAPMQPLGSFFGGVLADRIVKEGGYRNDKCRQMVEDYISGKYSYKDKEKDSELSEEEKAEKTKREEKLRRLLVETYLPTFEVRRKTLTADLKDYLTSLAGWAENRVRVLSTKPDNEGWISQLESLAELCVTFVLLLETSDMGESVDWRQVDNWVNTLYQGGNFMQYDSQNGCRELIDNPAKMAVRSRRTVWMSFSADEGRQPDCGFLYPSELEKIRPCLTIWDENKEMEYHRQMEMLPMLNTDEQLILVVMDYEDGELMQKHPFMVRLESQVENLEKFIVKPNLLEEMTEDVNLVRNENAQPKIEFQHADLLKWPEHFSPTLLSTFVEYPLDYVMERMLNIVRTGPGSIAELRTTKGTVAHAVIEKLFAPRDGKTRSTADEIEKRIEEEFEERVRESIEASGAILYLPENKLEAKLLTEQLRKCLSVLLCILRDNRLAVTGCEHHVTMDMGLIKNEKGWDMRGFIDMTLEDENHHPIVFDFKWTTSKKHYINLLKENRSVQLEFYRTMLSAEKHDTVERVAYFLMPECHLYSQEHFSGIHCTQLRPANNDNIIEQMKNSFLYRRKQLESGWIDIGEDFPKEMLDYYNDTEENSLFPLSFKDGKQERNRFSNYAMFKGLS